MDKKFIYIILGINAVLIIALIGSFFYFGDLIDEPEKKNDISSEFELDWSSPEDPLVVERSLADRIKSEVNDNYDIRRFFLSKIDKDYIPEVHWCLFENKDRMFPIFPSYVYENWGVLPEDSLTPQVSIVTYFLLSEDNANFHPDSSCYIKEIKTDRDWEEIENTYNF